MTHYDETSAAVKARFFLAEWETAGSWFITAPGLVKHNRHYQQTALSLWISYHNFTISFITWKHDNDNMNRGHVTPGVKHTHTLLLACFNQKQIKDHFQYFGINGHQTFTCPTFPLMNSCHLAFICGLITSCTHAHRNMLSTGRLITPCGGCTLVTCSLRASWPLMNASAAQTFLISVFYYMSQTLLINIPQQWPQPRKNNAAWFYLDARET